jgi:hypothetical protein
MIIPRLMTARWRKLLRKATDVLITIPVGTPIWPSKRHEPLVIAISFRLSTRRLTPRLAASILPTRRLAPRLAESTLLTCRLAPRLAAPILPTCRLAPRLAESTLLTCRLAPRLAASMAASRLVSVKPHPDFITWENQAALAGSFASQKCPLPPRRENLPW